MKQKRASAARMALVEALDGRAMLTATWLSAAGNGNWNSTNNWQGGHVPTAGEDVVFAAPGNSNFENVTLATPVVVGSMTFDGSYQFHGASIQPQGTLSTTQYTRFNNPLVLDRNTTINVGAGIRLDVLGGMTGNAFDLTKTGAGRLFVGSAVPVHSIHVDGGSLEQDGATEPAVIAVAGTIVRGNGTMTSLTSTGATLLFDDGDGGTTNMATTAAATLDAASTFATPVGDDGASNLRAGTLTASGSTAVHLGGATLSLIGDGSTPTIGGSVTLIANNTGLPVVGTFAGLPEGTTLTVGGFHLSITYKGGSSHHDVVLTTVSTPPSVVAPFTTVQSTSVRPTLAVVGTDAEDLSSALTYHWSVATAPANGRAKFVGNDTNAAKTIRPRFFGAGTYMLNCAVTDTSGATTVQQLTVKIKQIASGIRVTPHEAKIARGATLAYSAYLFDQFGARMRGSSTKSFALEANSAGSIDQAGLFTAGNKSGHVRVRVTIGDFVGLAGATVV